MEEVVMRVLLSVLGLAFGLGVGAAIAQTAAEREACMADFQKYCPGVQPGGGRIIKCLSEHLDQLTPQCKAVVEANMPK
jgi:Cysteine rich repeat